MITRDSIKTIRAATTGADAIKLKPIADIAIQQNSFFTKQVPYGWSIPYDLYKKAYTWNSTLNYLM